MNNLLRYAIMAHDAKYSKQILCGIYSEYDGIYTDIDFYQDEETDTELYTLDSKDTLYIIFRGTEPHCFRDILTDVNAFVVPYDNKNTNIRVHHGVYKSYQSVRTWIHAKIYTTYKKHNKKIVVIGHSLGGGLAPLCAVDIQYNYFIEPNYNGVECFIYGALKVFNKEGIISYNKRIPRTINIQNNRDIVIHMPPLFSYKHVGNVYTIKSKSLVKNHDIIYGYIRHLEGTNDNENQKNIS